MVGTTVSHYRILEHLGGGGMGVVYKAQDLKLDRPVALKFLPTELTRDPEAKERFILEARAASALQHNNICTVHDIDETTEGQLFIVMDLYEGETLKKKIERGPLSISEAIDFAAQVAQGLAEAHGHGIVHRDIKPANVMVTKSGVAKIVDFGLAKLGEGRMLTKSGTTLGTAEYMSPEQARGDSADARTDIWSLGVLLYEMTTGKRPFKGEYDNALIYSILNTDPEPITALRSGIPMELEGVVRKCLAKLPAQRYQHADELLVDLQRVRIQTPAPGSAKTKRKNIALRAGAGIAIVGLALLLYLLMIPRVAPPGEESIAVIPFVDMSPQKDQDYFCDGMTEELINRLTKIRDLRVPARTSAFVFKGKTEDVREIGRKLNVRTVLEGSVRKAGEGLRITAQLINVEDGYHLWSETYDRQLKDVFAIQDEISSAIVDALQLKLTSQEMQRLSEHSIDNVRAYDCYLKAERQIMRFDEKSLDSAHAYLQTAIDLVGDNAQLYSGLARVSSMYANIGIGQEEYIQQAVEYAKKALALDPNFPAALAQLGNLCIYEEYPQNIQRAFGYFKKALAVNPFETIALHGLSQDYQYVGRFAESFALVRRLADHDPLNPRSHLVTGFYYLYDCQFAAALEEFRIYYQTDPTSTLAQTIYSFALAYNGKRDEALAVLDQMEQSSSNVRTHSTFPVFGHLMKCALLKDKVGALGAMTPDFQKTCRRDFEWSYWIANRLSLLGAKEEALDWLDNAVSRGFINYPFLKCDPFLDNLRGGERFNTILQRAKYECEHFQIPE